jgi:hypothetical protein
MIVNIKSSVLTFVKCFIINLSFVNVGEINRNILTFNRKVLSSGEVEILEDKISIMNWLNQVQ